LQPNNTVFNISDNNITLREQSNGFQTVLGNLRENPFTIQNVANAHISLYNSNAQPPEPTNLYVKFLPTSNDDMLLLDSIDEQYYDFPLEYEIVELGDFYQDVDEGSFPVLYAVVDKDFSFPNIQYEIIDELFLDDSDPLLIAESFRLTGNGDEIEDYFRGYSADEINVFSESWTIIDDPDPCPVRCVTALYNNGQLWTCECPPPNPCDEGCSVKWNVVNYNPLEWEYECDCSPPPTPTNACGCPISLSWSKPAGCIKVEDTELSTPGDPNTFDGVRRVKVIMKDTWFKEDEVWTDDNGCWEINKSYRGDAWIWHKFKNHRGSIRGGSKNMKIWQWLLSVKDYVGKLKGPTFNNISVNYHMYSNVGSRAHRYWGAATVNNALHEYYDYANADGIKTPKDGMDVMVDYGSNAGFAFLDAKYDIAFTYGLTFTFFMDLFIRANDGYEGAPYWFNGGMFYLVSTLTSWFVAEMLPEVYVGIRSDHSDVTKKLAYHQFAHASHRRNVTKGYWFGFYYPLETHATADDHGYVSIVDSWAEFIGMTYAHRTYGNESNFRPETWEGNLEKFLNVKEGYSPVGLHHDLVDPTNFEEACNSLDNKCAIFSDNVTTITIADLFSLLDVGIKSVEDYEQSIIANLLGSTSNTQQDVELLFNEYYEN